MGGLIFLGVFALIFLGVAALVIVISSAIRKTSQRAGFVALGWATLIYLVASAIALFATRQAYSDNTVIVVIGAALTAALASRGGYRWGWSWLWLLLPGIGWWLLLWSRNNQLDRRKDEELVPTLAG